MAKVKFDGVVEAVHYAPDGRVHWVRAYEKRGPTFSDRVLLDRKTLIERLKAGKKFYAGQRVAYLSSTFELGQPIRLVSQNGDETLSTQDAPASRDQLDGVPVV